MTSIGSQRLATFPKGESKDNAGITKQAKPPKGKALNEVKVLRESGIKTHIFEYAHMLRV